MSATATITPNAPRNPMNDPRICELVDVLEDVVLQARVAGWQSPAIGVAAGTLAKIRRAERQYANDGDEERGRS